MWSTRGLGCLDVVSPLCFCLSDCLGWECGRTTGLIEPHYSVGNGFSPVALGRCIFMSVLATGLKKAHFETHVGTLLHTFVLDFVFATAFKTYRAAEVAVGAHCKTSCEECLNPQILIQMWLLGSCRKVSTMLTCSKNVGGPRVDS